MFGNCFPTRKRGVISCGLTLYIWHCSSNNDPNLYFLDLIIYLLWLCLLRYLWNDCVWFFFVGKGNNILRLRQRVTTSVNSLKWNENKLYRDLQLIWWYNSRFWSQLPYYYKHIFSPCLCEILHYQVSCLQLPLLVPESISACPILQEFWVFLCSFKMWTW